MKTKGLTMSRDLTPYVIFITIAALMFLAFLIAIDIYMYGYEEVIDPCADITDECAKLKCGIDNERNYNYHVRLLLEYQNCLLEKQMEVE